MNKPKVAYICVHNSCRSQLAEALGKHLAGDVFESYSAGTETKPSPVSVKEKNQGESPVSASRKATVSAPPHC